MSDLPTDIDFGPTDSRAAAANLDLDWPIHDIILNLS